MSTTLDINIQGTASKADEFALESVSAPTGSYTDIQGCTQCISRVRGSRSATPSVAGSDMGKAIVASMPLH
ncbi:hypothetical protein [Streptomyces sp. NPDC055709]